MNIPPDPQSVKWNVSESNTNDPNPLFDEIIKQHTVKGNIQQYLDACAEAIQGQNGSGQTFGVVCTLVEQFELDEIETLRWLHYYNQKKCRPKWSQSELRHKVDDAFRKIKGTGIGPPGTNLIERKWPRVEAWKQHEARERTGTVTVADLEAMSPVPVGDLTTESVLAILYPRDGLVCCGLSEYHAMIWPVHRWIDDNKLDTYQFIVPSLFKKRLWYKDGQLLLDKAGNPSVRLLDNVLERLYLVTDFDYTTEEEVMPRNEQATYIKYLSQGAPLVMVLDTGGKSLHAWWRVRGASEARLEEFFKEACQLGADPSKWHTNGWVRLPGGWRNEKKRRQRIIYFDPKQI